MRRRGVRSGSASQRTTSPCRALLARASLKPDNGVVPASDTARFIAAAKTRQWDREPQVRMLA